mgnify:CR=1 FL=1
MTVELGKPIAMDEGLRFAIREGGRTVGAGRVTKIIASEQRLATNGTEASASASRRYDHEIIDQSTKKIVETVAAHAGARSGARSRCRPRSTATR